MNQIELQNETITKVSDILRKYDSVRSFALEGSHAKGMQTEYSDIDMFVVFKTDERMHLKEIYNEVIRIQPTLCTLFQLYDVNSLILYENGVRLDLSFIKPNVFKTWSLSGVKVLYDPDNTIATVSDAPRKSEKPEWNESEGSYVDWFFWMFRQAYCYACQSERVASKSFEKVYLAQQSIQAIREQLLKTICYVHGSRDYLANIDAKYAHQLLSTYTSSVVDQMLEAIVTLLTLYEHVFTQYCQKENVDFPREKIMKMKGLFGIFDSTRR